jgi:hypothetical protein
MVPRGIFWEYGAEAGILAEEEGSDRIVQKTA